MTAADGGIASRLRSVAGSLADQVSLHGELFWIEWQAEKSRFLKLLVAWLVMILFAAFGLVFASTSAIVAAWDTPYRLHVALGLVLLYAIGFVIARRYVKGLGETSDGSFVGTREQLAETATFLKTLL